MPYNATPLVLHGGVRVTWLPDDRFWYWTTTEKGNEAFLIDPATGGRSTCDLAPCLDAVAGRNPPRTDGLSPDGKQAVFIRDWNLWVRDVASGEKRRSRPTA